MKRLLFTLALLTIASRVFADEPFKDVPKDHWAAESVKAMAEAGVLKGYPDGTFKGDKFVTRYELAVALDGMVRFLRASFEPVQTEPSGDAEKSLKETPGGSINQPGTVLTNLPVSADKTKHVSEDELARALAAVAQKLISECVPGDYESTDNP